MGNTIYAAFADPDHAERAAGALLDHGLRPEDLSVVRSQAGRATTTTSEGVISADPIGTEPAVIVPTSIGSDLVSDEPISYPDVVDSSGDVETSAKQGISITTGADAAAGAVKGTAWGAGIGALAALAALIVPGVGLVLGGGALAAALASVAASAGAGALAGAVTGYLKDQGIEEHVAHHYESTLGTGGALLAVTLPSGALDESRAREILEKYEATNINAYATKGYLA